MEIHYADKFLKSVPIVLFIMNSVLLSVYKWEYKNSGGIYWRNFFSEGGFCSAT